MNRYLTFFACASLAFSSASLAAAANRNDRNSGPGTDSPARVTALIGAKVENHEAENIGAVSDLAVDLASGRIVHVIVRSGGFLSIGSRTLAIPPDALRFDATTATARIDLPQARLKTAPDFEVAQWDEFYQSDRAREADRYHGSEPRLGAARPEKVRQVSKLLRLPVLNGQDERVGSVEDLVVELNSGRVVAAIVSTGGFLGMGDSLNAIPTAALQFDTAPDSLRLDMDKKALLGTPRFTSNEWPDFAQRDYADGLYRAYKVRPDAGNEGRSTPRTDKSTRNVRDREDRTPAQADNSARNVRDRDNRTLTPGDQGSSDSDIRITQTIRQAVVAAEGLSVKAQNVKIITVNGHVTLRGPVDSPAEKSRIGEIAARAVTPAHVDNQLEVTTR